MPPRINGNYYVHYVASVSFAHVEIVGTSGGLNVPVTGVTVAPTTVSLMVGASAPLTATVAPSNATNATVTWTSSNAAVAPVNASGVVMGVATGLATITARTQDGGFTATSVVNVTISNIPATGVSVSPVTASVGIGATTTITATVAPSNASNKTVTWSSNVPGVATVNASGVVTGVAAGNAIITALTQSGGFTASSTVTVTPVSTTPCTNPTAITLPFTRDGLGDFCWVTSGTVNIVNSWNMQKVEINGVDFTNKWANPSTLPPRINGNYYIHYVGAFPWSHFEITGTP